jgi:hypothetical protein
MGIVFMILKYDPHKYIEDAELIKRLSILNSQFSILDFSSFLLSFIKKPDFSNKLYRIFIKM